MLYCTECGTELSYTEYSIYNGKCYYCWREEEECCDNEIDDYDIEEN